MVLKGSVFGFYAALWIRELENSFFDVTNWLVLTSVCTHEKRLQTLYQVACQAWKCQTITKSQIVFRILKFTSLLLFELWMQNVSSQLSSSQPGAPLKKASPISLELLILIAFWQQNVSLNLAFFVKVLVIFGRRKRKLYYSAQQLKWLTDEIGIKKKLKD